MLTKKTSCRGALYSEVGSDPVGLPERFGHQDLPAANGGTHVCWSIEPDFLQTFRCKLEVEAGL